MTNKITEQDIAKKAVAYIETVQPELDKRARADDKFMKRANQAVGALCGSSIIDEERKDELLDKMAEDHSFVFDVVERLTKIAAEVPIMGSGESINEIKDMDPFDRLVYEDA